MISAIRAASRSSVFFFGDFFVLPIIEDMMQAERGRRNGYWFSSEGSKEMMMMDGFATIRANSSSSLASSASSSSSSSLSPRSANYIEHRVSKMDTVAGVAIKYGVEVADIRRMNGLVTDLQMFAHKSLHIPLPGRHPPSPIQSNGSAVNGEQTPPRRPLDDVLDSLQSLKLKPPQSKVSPAMSSLQGYYGLAPPKKDLVAEGTEMAVYRSERCQYLEDPPVPRESRLSDPLPGGHRKSRSLVNGLLPENGEIADVKAVAEASDNGDTERPIRRRQKADVDPSLHTPERLLKKDSRLLKEDYIGGFSGRTVKSLALRPKSGSRTDMDMSRLNVMPIVDSFLADGWAAVRRSSSTSNLQESENGSYVWPPSKWTLKPDIIARPIFDGLPKPITMRRNKAALD